MGTSFGRFVGGPAPDTAGKMYTGAKFVGARGNDRVMDGMYEATFHGGAGIDAATFCATGNTLTSVEIKTPVIC